MNSVALITGAASGIHDILPGQSAVLAFDGIGSLRCRAIPARAMQARADEIPG